MPVTRSDLRSSWDLRPFAVRDELPSFTERSGAPGPPIPVQGRTRPPTHPFNTLAVLSPVLAVVIPPAGVILGHWALVQIRRSGETGRAAATWGLIVGYLLTAALTLVLDPWDVTDPSGHIQVISVPRPVMVTTMVVGVPTTEPVKLDLADVPIGTCAEIRRRDVAVDALELFATPCVSREGTYTVVDHVADGTDCRSTYVAASPDHSFALCLNEFRGG